MAINIYNKARNVIRTYRYIALLFISLSDLEPSTSLSLALLPVCFVPSLPKCPYLGLCHANSRPTLTRTCFCTALSALHTPNGQHMSCPRAGMLYGAGFTHCQNCADAGNYTPFVHYFLPLHRLFSCSGYSFGSLAFGFALFGACMLCMIGYRQIEFYGCVIVGVRRCVGGDWEMC